MKILCYFSEAQYMIKANKRISRESDDIKVKVKMQTFFTCVIVIIFQVAGLCHSSIKQIVTMINSFFAIRIHASYLARTLIISV